MNEVTAGAAALATLLQTPPYHSLCRSSYDFLLSSLTDHGLPTGSFVRCCRETSSRNASSGDDVGSDVEVGVVVAVENCLEAAQNDVLRESLGLETDRQSAETLCIAAECLPGTVAGFA
jgi:hypothetical protein